MLEPGAAVGVMNCPVGSSDRWSKLPTGSVVVPEFLCDSSWDCASMATSGIRESTAKEATDRIEFFMETVLLLLPLPFVTGQ